MRHMRNMMRMIRVKGWKKCKNFYNWVPYFFSQIVGCGREKCGNFHIFLKLYPSIVIVIIILILILIFYLQPFLWRVATITEACLQWRRCMQMGPHGSSVPSLIFRRPATNTRRMDWWCAGAGARASGLVRVWDIIWLLEKIFYRIGPCILPGCPDPSQHSQ